MINNLTSKGRRMVTVVDPHLKSDKYDFYDEVKNKGYLVKNKDDNNYEGWCWPGTMHCGICSVLSVQ